MIPDTTLTIEHPDPESYVSPKSYHGIKITGSAWRQEETGYSINLRLDSFPNSPKIFVQMVLLFLQALNREMTVSQITRIKILKGLFYDYEID